MMSRHVTSPDTQLASPEISILAVRVNMFIHRDPPRTDR